MGRLEEATVLAVATATVGAVATGTVGAVGVLVEGTMRGGRRRGRWGCRKDPSL